MLYTEHTFRFRRHPEIGADDSPLDAETMRRAGRLRGAAPRGSDPLPAVPRPHGAHPEAARYAELDETDAGLDPLPGRARHLRAAPRPLRRVPAELPLALLQRQLRRALGSRPGKSKQRGATAGPGRRLPRARAPGPRSRRRARQAHHDLGGRGSSPPGADPRDRPRPGPARLVVRGRARLRPGGGLRRRTESTSWSVREPRRWNCFFPRIENSAPQHRALGRRGTTPRRPRPDLHRLGRLRALQPAGRLLARLRLGRPAGLVRGRRTPGRFDRAFGRAALRRDERGGGRAATARSAPSTTRASRSSTARRSSSSSSTISTGPTSCSRRSRRPCAAASGVWSDASCGFATRRMPSRAIPSPTTS